MVNLVGSVREQEIMLQKLRVVSMYTSCCGLHDPCAIQFFFVTVFPLPDFLSRDEPALEA